MLSASLGLPTSGVRERVVQLVLGVEPWRVHASIIVNSTLVKGRGLYVRQRCRCTQALALCVLVCLCEQVMRHTLSTLSPL